MNIFVRTLTVAAYANAMWKQLKGSWIAPYMSDKCQSLSALSLIRQFPDMPSWGPIVAQGWYDRPLRGAAKGWESQYPLPYDPTATIDVDLTSTNAAAFIVPDFCTVTEIGCGITVAPTVAKLNMDFNLYPTMADNVGTVVSKLDGTNGNIIETSIAQLAIGDVLYKDLANELNIDLNKGYSVNAIVLATAPSAGQGVPYVLVTPRAMNNGSLATMIASA